MRFGFKERVNYMPRLRTKEEMKERRRQERKSKKVGR
jgi:hypothetical protein